MVEMELTATQVAALMAVVEETRTEEEIVQALVVMEELQAEVVAMALLDRPTAVGPVAVALMNGATVGLNAKGDIEITHMIEPFNVIGNLPISPNLPISY